jgi:hypothetical protein
MLELSNIPILYPILSKLRIVPYANYPPSASTSE